MKSLKLSSRPLSLTEIDPLDIVLSVKGVMDLATPDDIAFAERVDFTIDEPFLEYLYTQGVPVSYMSLKKDIYTPKYSAFMNEILDLKDLYSIPRPFELAEMLGVDFPRAYIARTALGGSYPSGHAAMARYFAHALSEVYLAPNGELHRAELFRIANQIAWSRVQIGVHSIYDIEEGKRLADQLFADMR